MASHLRIKLRCCSRGTPLQVDEATSATGKVGTSKSENDEVKSETASARSMRKKRAMMEKDPIIWAAHKAMEAERHRNRRKNKTPEQTKRDKDNAAKRRRKYYARKKEEGKPATKKKESAKTLTRSELTKQRQYWREKQASCRENKSAQRKVWDRKKDRDRKRKMRVDIRDSKSHAEDRAACNMFTTPDAGKAQAGYSSSAKPKALSRLWSKLPSASKFAELVTELVNAKRLTPQKKAALETQGVSVTCCKKIEFGREIYAKPANNVRKLKLCRDDISRVRRRTIMAAVMVEGKYCLKRQLAQDLGMRPHYFTNIEDHPSNGSRFWKRRSDLTCMDVVENIQSMYRTAEISREMPTMRTMRKDLAQRRIMEVTVSRAYDIWKSISPGADVSLSTFQKLRPIDVLPLRQNKLNQCLCEYCTDILLKLQSLNQVASLYSDSECKIVDKYALLALTLCKKEEGSTVFRLRCVDRICDECGVQLLDDRFVNLVQASGDREVTWRKWQNKAYPHDWQSKTKKILVSKSGCVSDLVRELKAETEALAKHVFVANWQQNMYSKISSRLPRNSVTFVLDFAENYACTQQDEIQAAHWAIEQVTIHPIVAFMMPEHTDTMDSHIIQEAIVIISSDLKHDAHAVQHFTRLALDHLRLKRGLTVEQVLEFTDGCAVQYKSKLPFADISYARKDLNVSLERHFFGSRHGKGPSDCVSGVAKSAARRAVMSRQAIINTAETMYEFCTRSLTKNECTSQQRVFIFVKSGEICRDRPDRLVKTAVVGTRGLHAIKSVKPGVIAVHLLSCFCDECLGGRTGLCENMAYTPPWQTRALTLVNPPICDTGVLETPPECSEPERPPTGSSSDGPLDFGYLSAEQSVQRLCKSLEAEAIPPENEDEETQRSAQELLKSLDKEGRFTRTKSSLRIPM
uniref:Uncharacterized protein n=1 Tax=Eptatretus burgeri TaxID=7764 RepID=A0A8C4WX24_EPTBU